MTTNGRPVEIEEIFFSDLSEVRRIQAEIEAHLQANAFSEKEIYHAKMAIEEALVNAIKHGNQMDKAKKVQVAYQVSPERFHIEITDEGAGFNPEDVPDPTDPDNLERPCGRGLFMMRYYMTDVQVKGRGNSIAMTKTRKPAS